MVLDSDQLLSEIKIILYGAGGKDFDTVFSRFFSFLNLPLLVSQLCYYCFELTPY